MIVLTWAVVRPAFCADALSFPPTSYTILNPDTKQAIGNSVYRADATSGGVTLSGVNRFFDHQLDVETSHLESGSAGQGPKLIDFDHTFYKADGSLLIRGYLDLKSGAATCIDNSSGQNRTRATVLSLPDDTWAGASIAAPIQDFLRAGDLGKTRSLHVFSCAPAPKIFAVSVTIDPHEAQWPPYGAKAVQVEVRPDFGLINPLIASFLPKIHAWFDPADKWALVGDESARWYKGPPVMLVKTHDGAGTAAQSK
ncbi:MAG TPA: hypothetical protein VEY94_00395 [Patescibacteria group bacterium]|nr:hypothetical protein [Patescibacteria group bacterium]